MPNLIPYKKLGKRLIPGASMVEGTMGLYELLKNFHGVEEKENISVDNLLRAMKGEKYKLKKRGWSRDIDDPMGGTISPEHIQERGFRDFGRPMTKNEGIKFHRPKGGLVDKWGREAPIPDYLGNLRYGKVPPHPAINAEIELAGTGGNYEEAIKSVQNSIDYWKGKHGYANKRIQDKETMELLKAMKKAEVKWIDKGEDTIWSPNIEN